MKIRSLLALTLVFIATNSGRAEDISWLYGTWDAVKYWGTNQLPDTAKTTFEFKTNGICIGSGDFGDTNQFVCEGAYSVSNGVITYRKDAEHVANMIYSITNSFLILHEDEKGWDSWMKLEKR